MAEYQIRELAHLTGVKPHTIRVWEQRYGLLAPKRTPTNIRFYDDDDLCVLLNVALLSDHGYRISRIAQLSPDQRAQEVTRLTAEARPDDCLTLQLLVRATLALDDALFGQALGAAIAADGLGVTMLQVIYPFLERIGILWQTGTINPAQEHLITGLVRQKIIVAIDGLSAVAPAPDARRFVLFLPETELHELALLFMCYLLRARGQRVTYLGQTLPIRDLAAVCTLVRPDFLLTVLTVVPERAEVAAYASEMGRCQPDATLLLYGLRTQESELTLPPGAQRFGLMTDFVTWLEKNFPAATPA